MKIKYQLLLTHGLLVFLSLIIVLINVFAYRGMVNDAIIINKSGKLRALSYNMVQLSNRINIQENMGDTTELNEKLRQRINDFEEILSILMEQEKEGIDHSQTVARLEKISKEWDEVFKPLYLKILKEDSISETCTRVNDKIDFFVNDINEMVTLYSVYSREKVFIALIINGGLVPVIILVTIYSFNSTKKRIQRPMNDLMRELKDLSYIDDEITSQLKNINTDEISEMTHYFNEIIYDQLTKSFNRRSGLARLNRIIQLDITRHLKLSFCFIDINGLKEVNDRLGHKYGDELIVSVVECIKKEIRDEDFIIRMGGDEFLIVFNGIDEEISEKVWERILKRYQYINEQEGRLYLISVSHGIVTCDKFEKVDIEFLIKNADDKMYAEKKYIKETLKVQIIRNTADIDNPAYGSLQ